MAEYVPPLSLDLRTRIVDAYESGEGSYAQIAKRYGVCKAVVGKLVRQKRQTGSLESRLNKNGQDQELFTAEQKQALWQHLIDYPLATVEDRRRELDLPGTFKTVWKACRRLGARFKKRRPARSNRNAKT